MFTARPSAALVAISALGFGLGSGEAQLTYPGCTDVTANEFTEVVVIDRAKDGTLNEPVGFSVGKDGRVFLTERRTGKLKTVGPDGAFKLMVTFPLHSKGEENKDEVGLRYVTPDPNFETNRWLYLLYTPTSPAVNRIIRVTVKSDWTVDLASMKTILDMPWTYDICCHQGGGMDWDAFGNLYVSSGNNKLNSDDYSVTNEAVPLSDNQGGTSNTMDYRGKIIRIKPVAFADTETPAPGAGRTYSVPAGNYRDFFTTKGFYAAADQAKILPEIYTLGHRNPFTLNVDKYTGILTFGDVGPDASVAKNDSGPEGYDEFNVVKEPGFYGFPYFVGDNKAYVNNNKNPPVKWDAAAPMNESPNNTGVKKLPAAVPAIIPESRSNASAFKFSLGSTGGGSCAVSGPIYRYDGSNPSKKKLPPHFDGKWFVGEFSRKWLKVASLNAGSTEVTDLRDFPYPGGFNTKRSMVLGMQIGADGALYIMDYGGVWWGPGEKAGIFRIEYKGTCAPTTPVPQLPTVALSDQNRAKQALLAPQSLRGSLKLPAQFRAAEVFDLTGKQVMTFERGGLMGEIPLQLPQGAEATLLKVRYIP